MDQRTEQRFDTLLELGFQSTEVRSQLDRNQAMIHQGFNALIGINELEDMSNAMWRNKLRVIKEAHRRRGCIGNKTPFFYLRNCDGERYDGDSGWVRSFDKSLRQSSKEGREPVIPYLNCPVEIVTVYI